MRIAVCIPTCLRPRWLAATLESLKWLLIDERTTEVAVFVVDNDSNGSARETVSAIREGFRWPLSYEIEPQRGISFARNRAVRLALAWEADFLAFLDDDETASPGWLAELLAAQQLYHADVVSGPRLPSYEPGVAEWAMQGRFFEHPRHSTGTRLQCTATANCLISCRLLAKSTDPFHPAFARPGLGEDAYFFRRAHRQGASIVWASDAIVYERVSPSRATVPWLLERAYRGGTVFALGERLLHRTPAWMLLRGCTGTVRCLQGLVLLLPALFRGKPQIVRALQTVCSGAGLLSGILGISYEYTAIQGE